MPRSLKLTWATSHYTLNLRLDAERTRVEHGIRVRIDVDCAVGLSPKIFAYRMLPVAPVAITEGFFSHICSPPDMAEYPEDGPTPGSSPEWFRLSYVDVFVRSVQEAEDFISIVREDARSLVQTLNKMDTIFTGGTEIVGSADCQPQQSSSDNATGSSSESLGAVESVVAVGSSEQSVGVGVQWTNIGTGAGSPIGSSDSAASNYSRVVLQAGESSKLLLVQGFDFSDLPEDAVIVGIVSRVTLRDATNDPASGGSDSSSGMDSQPPICPCLTLLALQSPDQGVGTNLSTSECISGPAWETLSHGGEGEMLGLPQLTAQDLKDGAFGLGLILHNGNPALEGSEGADGCLVVPNYRTRPITVEVDGAELEVFFREPG